MEFIKENYRLTVEEDSEGFDINLYLIIDAESPLIYLNLKPLNTIDTEFDDKLQVRDIPRHLFNDGDYYQSSVTKYTSSNTYRNISLLAVIHEILLENRTQILNIKNIYSSSLNRYKEEVFFTDNAINFWNIQLSKSLNIPVCYFKEDKRYFLQLNENLK